jgi:hypothetical protein
MIYLNIKEINIKSQLQPRDLFYYKLLKCLTLTKLWKNQRNMIIKIYNFRKFTSFAMLQKRHQYMHLY